MRSSHAGHQEGGIPGRGQCGGKGISVFWKQEAVQYRSSFTCVWVREAGGMAGGKGRQLTRALERKDPVKSTCTWSCLSF